MSFTESENAALGALALGFPVPDVDVEDVEEAHSGHYLKQVRNLAVNALYYAKAYDMAVDPGLVAAKAVILEERRKAETELARARAVEVRESHVSGLLAGFVPRAMKMGSVAIDTSDVEIDLTVYNDDGAQIVAMRYDRETYQLSAVVDGENFTEDWSALNGNSSPKVQSAAYAAVLALLDGGS